VRLSFLLPETVLVSPGPHGFNTSVLPGNVVRIVRQIQSLFSAL
jgi:hypothetical protein